MPVTHPVDLPVRWHLSVQPDGAGKLTFEGELDAESTAVAWRALQTELAGIKALSFEIDVRQLVCDSAGLALLYYLSIGGMTPGVNVTIMDKLGVHSTPLAKNTASALMAAWDADLRAIMEEINSEYAKTRSINQ